MRWEFWIERGGTFTAVVARRAAGTLATLKLLSETGLLKGSEVGGAKAVLDAAALTYVAALVMTVLQLVRLLALRGMRRD